MTPRTKPLCPYDLYQSSVPNLGLNVSRSFTKAHFHQVKLQLLLPGQNAHLSFEVTATTPQQPSHVARLLDLHAQEPNIPFKESLTSTGC